MAVGYKIISYDSVLPEQVLAHFGIVFDENNKCICPFHDETVPSMQVNEAYVHCYGCKYSADVWKLTQDLFAVKNQEMPNIGAFLRSTVFPSPSGRIYQTNKYAGPVPTNLIEYWHNCLLRNGKAYINLLHERLFSGGIITHFKLGWRPDTKEYVIPYLYKGQIDIVQFRSTKPGKKYRGLTNHNRGSIINRDILDTPQDYVVILMGAFDPLLAWQDGLPAVGMNGSFPFRRDDKERVQQMFKQQKIKFIVPDNNPEEVKAAHKLAEWIDGDVRTFPENLEHNLDYIDYRKLGKTVEDFKREVLGILPYDDYSNHQLLPSLQSLYDVGNRLEFATVYCEMLAKGVSWSDMAITLANNHVKNAVSRRQMYNVKNKEDFISAMRYKMRGMW